MFTPITVPDREGAAQRVSHLRASFRSDGATTRLENRYHTAPVKIAKAFPLGGPLGVIVMDVSPGLLDGDRYEMEWHAGDAAHFYVTNQSYTKVHPSGPRGSGSSLVQRFTLAPDSVVESMPEPVMLYRDALFSAETEVTLSRGAVWMQAEVLCPGRTLRGERFQYRSYRNRLRVSHGNELIFAQNQFVIPGQQSITSPGCFGEMTHTGVFYAFSDRIAARHVEAVRATVMSWPVRQEQPVIGGVSATHKYGLAVMAAGMAAWPLQEFLVAAWGTLRQSLLGLAPLHFRK